MPLPDATTLRTEVAIPADGERHPVMLMRTPYGRSGLRAFHDPIGLARTGWATVIQDVRGRWGSEGAFEPMFQERSDGAAAVAWCAQQPWSNGNVAMTGGSYNGFVQWAAALGKPKGLRAIAPTITTPFIRDTWFGEGDAFRVGSWALWALSLAAGGTGGPVGAEKRAWKTTARWRELVSYPTDVDAIAAALPAFRDWIAAEHEYWKPAEPASRLRNLDVAGHHVAGWYDIFLEGSLDAYSALAHDSPKESVRRAQRLVVGPWFHGPMTQLSGEIDFGPDANWIVHGVLAEQLQFLRDAVEGREVKGGASIFVMGRNKWLELETWPPPAKDVSLHLAADGRLDWSAPERTGRDTYRHDPRDPVPTRGGRHMHWGLPPSGPVDQRPLEGRGDTLVYTSEPLKHDLVVLGKVRAELRFASSAPRADVTVKLVDVHPDGTAYNIVDSVRRVGLTPGRARRVDVEVGSTAMVFKRGHRIRVQVASSNWPFFDLLGAADQTLHRGGRSGSRLVLPAYDG